MWQNVLCNTLCSVIGSFDVCVGSLKYLQERMVLPWCSRDRLHWWLPLFFLPETAGVLEVKCEYKCSWDYGTRRKEQWGKEKLADKTDGSCGGAGMCFPLRHTERLSH